MAFNAQKFETVKFQDRTTTIKTPTLKCFFDDGEEPEWTLKCISASEVATARDHVKNSRNREQLIDGLFKNAIPDPLLQELKEKVGISRTDGKVHGEVIFKKALLMFASVKPKCSEVTALILAQNYPEVFEELATAALILIGQGQQPGELIPCGEITDSRSL